MNKLYKKVGITEKQLTLSQQQPKQRVYNSIYNNIIHEEGFNYMADLIMLPQTKQGYKYLLVVVDLYTNGFDIEPLKKKDAETTLKAYQQMLKRNFIEMPQGTMRTDSGSEFKAVFNKFLITNNIIHRVSLPNRHKQTGPVENLNRTISKLLMSYIVHMEEKTGKDYNEWTDILSTVRTDLNKIRKETRIKEKKHLDLEENEPVYDSRVKQAYQVGDYVYNKLDWPEDSWQKKQPTAQRRMGDYNYSREPKKIVRVILMNDAPYHRYLLYNMPNVSYSEDELIPVPEDDMQILTKVGAGMVRGGKYHYLAHLSNKDYDTIWIPEHAIRYDDKQIWINT
jgi:hypothetical protein